MTSTPRIFLTAASLCAAALPGAAQDAVFTHPSGATATFYGQFNPTFQSVDDGDSSHSTVVDNSNSVSRVGVWIDVPLASGKLRFNFETGVGLINTAETSQEDDGMASMVVFEDGLPRKSEYRTFAIRGADGDGARDDTEAMREVMHRRFRHFGDKRPDDSDTQVSDTVRLAGAQNGIVSQPDGGYKATSDTATETDPVKPVPKRFAYPPQLVIVDGGAPQVNAAWEVFQELGITNIALCGLAKRLEEVWLPQDEYPLILERSSQGLYMMQQIRDEAHRFAIRAHRNRRSKAMTASALDDVPGVGPVRAKALLAQFGTVKAIKAASVEEIAAVPGMGALSAQRLQVALGVAEPAHEADTPKSRAPERGESTTPTSPPATSL